MKIKVFISIFVIVFFSSILHAQDTLTLEDAILKGLENNYQIRISKLESDIASNNNSWGQAGAYPTINLVGQSLNSSREFESDDTVTTPGYNEIRETQSLNINLGAELQWVVFNGFRVRITKSRLENLQAASEGNASIVIENTLQSIILTYYLAELQQETLVIFEDLLRLSRDRYHYMVEKKNIGSAVSFDVLQAETNYFSDSANVLRQRLNFQNALRNLNLVLAEPVNNMYSLKKPDIEIEGDFHYIDLVSKMESSNQTLKNQYLYQEILTKNTRINQSSLYPVIRLSSGFTQNFSGSYSDFNNGSWTNPYNYSANLSLSWTLSNGGNVRRAIENARTEEQIGQMEIEEMRQSLNNRLFSVFEDFNVKKQLKQVAALTIESSKLSLQIAEDKFKTGVINSFNYRDLQLNYQNAALDLAEAEYNLIDTFTELLRLTGGIVSEFKAM